MLKSLVHRVVYGKPSEISRLIDRANAFARHTPHRFRYRTYDLRATDFLSVAWQIMELFEEERLRFNAATDEPVVIDCGANVGISALYFRSLHPRCRLTCFEPDAAVFACLKANLDANGAGDVACHREAVWTHAGGVAFMGDGADGGAVGTGPGAVQVPSVRLKDVLARHPVIDLLKIDIEGAECEVLLDCADELERVRHLYVEYHSFPGREQRLNEVLAVLTAAGFRYQVERLGVRGRQPFMATGDGPMDLQLDIHAIRRQAAVRPRIAPLPRGTSCPATTHGPTQG